MTCSRCKKRDAAADRKMCRPCLDKRNRESCAYYHANRAEVCRRARVAARHRLPQNVAKKRTPEHRAKMCARARHVRETKPDDVRRWKRDDYLRNSDAYKARAIRQWFRKQYPGLDAEHIEWLCLGTELRRAFKAEASIDSTGSPAKP